MARFKGVDDQFSRQLLKALVARGWDQKDLADRMFCSPSQISLLIRAKRYPTYETLLGIAKVLDVTLDWLCLGVSKNENRRYLGERSVGDAGQQGSSGTEEGLYRVPRYRTKQDRAVEQDDGDTGEQAV